MQRAPGSAQRRDECPGLGRGSLAQRRSDELEGRGPAFRPSVELRQDVRLERPPVCLAEEAFRLGGLEAESVAADLGHFAKRPESGDRQDRRPSAQDHDAQALGSAGHDLAHDLLQVRRALDEVVVVEDEDGPLVAEGLEVAHERREDRAHRGAAGTELTEERPRRRSEVRIGSTARGDEVMQDGDPVAIGLVEAVPDRPESGPAGEVREQRRLAVARLGDHEDQPMVDLRVEPLEEPIAGERFVPEDRGLDLGRLDREGVHVRGARDGVRWRLDRRSARTDRDGHAVPGSALAGDARSGVGRRERYGQGRTRVNAHARGVSGGSGRVWLGRGHGRHGDREGSPVD